MSDLGKKVSNGKRVRLAIIDTVRELGGTITTSTNRSNKISGRFPSNISHVLAAKGASLIFDGIGKGNSLWVLEIHVGQKDRRTYRFKSLEDLMHNAVSRLSKHHLENKEVVKRLRFICRTLNENQYEVVGKPVKDYDVMLWRRAKKDMAACLKSSPKLYQEFVGKAAGSMLNQQSTTLTDAQKVEYLRTAQLIIKELCDI